MTQQQVNAKRLRHRTIVFARPASHSLFRFDFLIHCDSHSLREPIYTHTSTRTPYTFRSRFLTPFVQTRIHRQAVAKPERSAIRFSVV